MLRSGHIVFVVQRIQSLAGDHITEVLLVIVIVSCTQPCT